MRPGIRSSEFLVAAGTALLIALNDRLGLGLDADGIAGLVGIAAAYAAQRGYVKRNGPADGRELVEALRRFEEGQRARRSADAGPHA